MHDYQNYLSGMFHNHTRIPSAGTGETLAYESSKSDIMSTRYLRNTEWKCWLFFYPSLRQWHRSASRPCRHYPV